VHYSLGFVEREILSLIKKNGKYAIQAIFHISLKGVDLITNKRHAQYHLDFLKMVPGKLMCFKACKS